MTGKSPRSGRSSTTGRSGRSSRPGATRHSPATGATGDDLGGKDEENETAPCRQLFWSRGRLIQVHRSAPTEVVQDFDLGEPGFQMGHASHQYRSGLMFLNGHIVIER
jgi:hypothetical protein